MAGIETEGDLKELIESGQGDEGAASESAEKKPKGKPKQKPSVAPSVAPPVQQAFVGSPCEVPGCKGTLKSLSTLDTPTHREQHLACAVCLHKPKNNVLRTPRTIRRQS